MKSINRRAVGALLLGVALSLSACTTATSSDNSASTDRTLSAEAAKCVEGVSTSLGTAMEPTELISPAGPLDFSSLEGDSIWFISSSMNQFSTDMSAGAEEAAKAAGMKLVRFDGQGSSNRYNEGIEQAVAQQAAGILLVGIDPSLVSSALAVAGAAGIPVLNAINSDRSVPAPANMYGNLTSDFTMDGGAAADWMLTDSGCDVNVAIIYASQLPIWDNAAQGAKKRIEEQCSECDVTLLDIDFANVATSIGSELQSALQRNPDINYVFPVWDSAVTFVDPILATANSKAKVVSRDGLQPNLDSIRDGGQAMTVAMPPTGWIGWIAVDDLARAMLGKPAPGYYIPTRVVDSSNIGKATPEDVFPNYVDYAAEFKEAWGQAN
ncbi:sugar ABC transporter substrate-binding protein [Gordonia sp. GN26]